MMSTVFVWLWHWKTLVSVSSEGRPVSRSLSQVLSGSSQFNTRIKLRQNLLCLISLLLFSQYRSFFIFFFYLSFPVFLYQFFKIRITYEKKQETINVKNKIVKNNGGDNSQFKKLGISINC